MRNWILACNWKMNLSLKEAVDLAKKISSSAQDRCSIILLTPTSYLHAIQGVINNHVNLGGQNCHHQVKGAYTGENSAQSLKEVGATYCIVGHSETRVKEGDLYIKDKIHRIYESNLIPILCIGESKEDREQSRWKETLKKQLQLSIEDRFKDREMIVAYEPIWSIGTGQTPSLLQLDEVFKYLQKELPPLTSNMSYLYGGSVSEKNIDELKKSDRLQGFLIGGASLKVDSFFKMRECLQQ